MVTVFPLDDVLYKLGINSERDRFIDSYKDVFTFLFSLDIIYIVLIIHTLHMTVRVVRST